jgi:hypothetical protein
MDNLCQSTGCQEPAHDLPLLQLWRQQQDIFEKHLELKQDEILNLKRLLSHRDGTNQGTQMNQDDSKVKVDWMPKEDIIQIVNGILSVDSDSIPFFESVQQFKSWILDLQAQREDYTSHQPRKNSSVHRQVETQTEKALAFSLLTLFAKELKHKNQKSLHNQNIKDLNDKLNAALKQLDYQMNVNADIKRLIVQSVIGNQNSNNYSFWGSDLDIKKNILDLYNDALVKIGKLNYEIDTLKSENVQLNQILEDFLIATIE